MKKLLVRCHAVTERCMGSQGQNYTHDIIRQRAPVEPGNIEISGRIEFIGQHRWANPSEYLVCIFGWIRRRIGESRHFFCKVADWLEKSVTSSAGVARLYLSASSFRAGSERKTCVIGGRPQRDT
jgi:hypothetical protein